jgi:predicted permease
MSLYTRLRNVLRPSRLSGDLDRELAFHLAERAEELESSGLPHDEALRTARLRFGNYTSQIERTRDMDISAFLDSLLRNFRHSARGLRKTPAFTLTVILTLTLGIGANSAVFSAINAILLRPLPFPNADRLVRVHQSQPKIHQPFIAPIRLEEWNRLNTTFQGITGYYTQDSSEFSGELPEKIRVAFVAPRFLRVWGIAPILGRDFTPEEETFGGPEAALISERLWKNRFARNPHVIGKALRFGRTGSTPIVGVLPASMQFADRDIDVWRVSAPQAPYAQSRESSWFIGFGRLKAGVTLPQALANLAAVQASLARQFPKPDALITPTIEPLKESAVHGISRSLWLLFASVSLLLLIACTNIAALLLARAADRRHEISVRFSLGASRASVVGQLLTEVFLLALAGAAFGLVAAAGASRFFHTLAKDLPRIDEISLDWRIVLYSLACAAAATLLCGLAPALRAARRNLAGSLASSGRAHVSGRNPIQFTLVGVQVALAVTLLAGAGLLLRSFQELSRVSPGFEPEHVLTLHISTSWAETNDFKASRQRVERILEALRALPGVDSAASAYNLPGVPGDYQIEMRTSQGRAETEPKILAQARGVTATYFATMRIPLLAGDLCRDEPNLTPMMVNRTFADTYFAGSSVIGRNLLMPAGSFLQTGVVRGIVGDAREAGLDREPGPVVYWCSNPNEPGTWFLVRTHGDPIAMANAVRSKIHEIEPYRSVFGASPLTSHISDAYAENRLRTILLAFFAATAISLACVGVYGTLSYLVKIRQREVALRLALGALRPQVVRHFLAQGLRVACLGCVAGLALAAAATRFLAGMLYGVSAGDTATLSAVVVLVLAVSAIASLLPALRAAGLDPMQVLRED